MLSKGLTLTALVLLTGCSGDITPTYQNESKLSAEQKQLIDTAWQAFKAKCPGINNSDSVELSLTTTEQEWCHTEYKCEKYGWLFEVGIKATKGSDKHFYYLGKGDSPGMIAKKDTSAELCGWQPTKMADTFMAGNW